MLRSALALISSLQIGLRIRESIERSLRQALFVAVAALLLIAAACFGLFAAYQALILSYGFTPPEAACLIAALLAALALVVLAVFFLTARRPKPTAPSPFASAGESVGLLDQSVGKAMQQVGPVGLLAIAFIAGLLASRRK
jgi:protein-S-isoprenylcysteine O-methyltransferase Ste14